MAGEKGLDYYLANPDEMPDDISALEAEMNAGAGPTEPELAVVESVPADAAVKPEVVEAPKAEEQALIETKQGKPAIPYAVLAGERERRHAAEQAVESLRKELDALSAKVGQAGTQANEQQPEATTDQLSDVALAEMAESYPEIGSVLKALSAKTRALDEQIAKVTQLENARVEQEQKRSTDEVQEAIDANPTLRYWQAADPQLWEEAVRLDEMIKANPANQAQTLSERFDKVVTAIEAIYGKSELPDAYKPPKAPDTSIEQVAAKAKAVVDKAGTFTPKTLSDMPGGSTPPTTERERLENMSPHELQRLMDSMDPDQLASFIAKAA